MTDHITRLKEALEAGPTEGPWVACSWIVHDKDGAIDACGMHVVTADGKAGVFSSSPEGDDVMERDVRFIAAANPAAIRELLERLERAEKERDEFREALAISSETYRNVQAKADHATATVYQFHYAMKDAGWHPGRTNDYLPDIIRAKGVELSQAEKDARRYRFLRDDLDSGWAICEWCDDHDGIGYYRDGRAPGVVDAAIDAAIASQEGGK